MSRRPGEAGAISVGGPGRISEITRAQRPSAMARLWLLCGLAWLRTSFVAPRMGRTRLRALGGVQEAVR